MKKFSTQLDDRLITFLAPNGWLDSQNARSVLAAAGIPSPIEDFDLMDAIEKYARLLNRFLDPTKKSFVSVDATELQPMKKLKTKLS